MGSARNRALLFLAGGVAAAAITAYLTGALDPYLGKKTEAAVSASQPPASKAEPKEGRLPAGQAAQTPAAQAPATPEQPTVAGADQKPAAGQAAPATEAPVVAPSFDVVRAESDGSLVIAGKAAANAKVEIVLGARVIGNAVAGPEGDFAVALDAPLKPGDHQIVLRATGTDNIVATSAQTAVVSIPENKNGQVLALVEQPGAPSKLISVPEPEPAAKTAEQAPAPAAQAPALPEPASSTETGGAPATTNMPEQQAAAPAAQPADKAAPAATASGPVVKVEAVEIEGRKIFVAGSADPGRKVRGYANEILLGEVITSPGGRFLIEAERDLPVGDYIIRVDGLEPDGVKVAARAAVPFEREASEAQAAVAPASTGQPADASQTAPSASGEASGSGASQQEAQQPAGASGEVAAVSPDQLAPKLQNVDGAVIIRRGDSLWRISRRVYGLGVRYSTIYLANQDQISDPNRIWPGQVFKVPEKTPHGEAADMKAVGEQATTLPQ